MDIYRISQDYEFKELLFDEEKSQDSTLNFKGESLIRKWIPVYLFMYIGKTKKDKNKREDFDASCFFDGSLFIKKEIGVLFSKFLGDKIELLPIIVNSEYDKFLFVNVLSIIEAIDFSQTKTMKEKMEMLRGNDIKFNLLNINSFVVFRDKVMNTTYYCTEEFIHFIRKKEIKGLRFVKVGTAK